jgi:hypothetical protein
MWMLYQACSFAGIDGVDHGPGRSFVVGKTDDGCDGVVEEERGGGRKVEELGREGWQPGQGGYWWGSGGDEVEGEDGGQEDRKR